MIKPIRVGTININVNKIFSNVVAPALLLNAKGAAIFKAISHPIKAPRY